MILIEYLLRNGSDRFIRDVKDRIDTINNKKRYQARSSKIDDVERARQGNYYTLNIFRDTKKAEQTDVCIQSEGKLRP